DPDDFIKQNGPIEFSKLLVDAVHYISFEIACIQKRYNLSNPEHRVRFATEAADILSKLDNAIERNVYAGEVSRMTGVEEGAIRSEIDKRVQKEDMAFQNEAEKRRQLNQKASNVVHHKEKGLMEAQRSILYYCASEQKIYEKLVSVLEKEDFTEEIYYRVFQAIGQLWRDAGNVFPAELVSFFENGAEQ
ncbi:hypothetical protein, partial [Anaerotignum sp.]|uniref:hypothetical protein n=1 Tax=Anaerotignum sp. TaxID=2039241 RepID=UPI002899C478